MKSLSAAVSALVKHSSFSKAIIIGEGASGYAAMVLAQLCARKDPRKIGCLVFSPHTLIDPQHKHFTANLRYRRILAWIDRRGGMDKFARSANNYEKYRKSALAPTVLVYGDLNAIDRVEAQRASSHGVRMWPVPFKFHATIIPFIVQGAKAAGRQATIEQLHAYYRKDQELRSGLPQSPDQLAAMCRRVRWLKSLEEMIEVAARGI